LRCDSSACQKKNRVQKQKDNEDRPAQTVAKEKAPPVFTNVVMLQKKNQEFEHTCCAS